MVRVGPEPPRVIFSRLSLRARRELAAEEANMAPECAAAESWVHGRKEVSSKATRASRGSQAVQSAETCNVSRETLAEDEVGRGAVNRILLMMGSLRPTGGSLEVDAGARQSETYAEPEARHAEAGDNGA